MWRFSIMTAISAAVPKGIARAEAAEENNISNDLFSLLFNHSSPDFTIEK